MPVAIGVSILGWSEWVHCRASGRQVGIPTSAPGRQAILVLGCRNRGTRANYLNRYRVRVALRSIDDDATETVLIFCGGGVGRDVPEADLLRRHALELGYNGAFVLERDSRTTWENIANTVDLLQEFDTVKVASNSLHAEKARAYLWQQRPDLGRRLVPARDYTFGEISFVKPLAALRSVRNLHRLSAETLMSATR